MAVRVQREDFDLGAEVEALTGGRTETGAVVTFVGLVRGPSQALTLEHYPGMAERELSRLEAEARERWPLDDVLIVHRFGRLVPGERIMMVATLSAHRSAAFESAGFLMDFLKTRAPFWKSEEGPEGVRWVEAKAEDEDAERRWHRDTPA